jgi:hypothetical protein
VCGNCWRRGGHPLLFTHEDDPGESQWFGSVKQLAKENGVRVETPDDPNTPYWVEEGAAGESGISVFLLLSLPVESMAGGAERGALNMHGSLLPKYRGRAPIHWAIIHGEAATGASLHYMLEKPDAGALVDQPKRYPFWRTTMRSRCREGRRCGAAGAASKPAGADGGYRRGTAAWISRRARISGAAAPKMAVSTGGRPRDSAQFGASSRAALSGAFTDVNGCRLALLETRVDDQPVRYAGTRPVCMRRMMCGTPIASMAGV